MVGSTCNSHSGCAIGIDPGTRTCGIAGVASDGSVEFTLAVRRADLVESLTRLVAGRGVEFIAVGGGTGSKSVVDELRGAFKGARIVEVDEARSTVEGVKLALSETRAFARPFLMAGFLVGISRRDGWAAAVIARRALDAFPHVL